MTIYCTKVPRGTHQKLMGSSLTICPIVSIHDDNIDTIYCVDASDFKNEDIYNIYITEFGKGVFDDNDDQWLYVYQDDQLIGFTPCV